jgi:hypothetical protein
LSSPTRTSTIPSWSEFRGRLLDGGAETLSLDGLLARRRERGLLKASGRQRTDSTHVLAAVRALNRLELVRETMRYTLDVLAGVAPDWLRSRAAPEWAKRYQRQSDEERLPKGKDAQRELAELIGADGVMLLTAISAPRPRSRCRTCRWWRRCIGCGCKTSGRPSLACAGGQARTDSQNRHSS